MSLPVLHLTGSPFEQGRRHGDALKDRVAHNLDVYFDRFERETKLSRPEVLERAALYRDAIAEQSPDYFEGMRGVAEGSGFTLDEIVALNVRYEILYYQFGALAMEKAAHDGGVELRPDGCTAFAVLPEASANSHLIMGQNWDWIPQVKGAILHTTERDGLETMAFTEVGIVGAKIGFNSLGLGLAVNGMTSTDDDWSTLRKPYHVRCYEILRSPNVDFAVRVVTARDRSCSTNFLIAQAPNRVMDVEAAPEKFRLLACTDGCLVHTNHFLDPAETGVVEPPNKRRPHSYNRRSRMAELLEDCRPVEIDEIKDALRDHDDHPFGVCRHEDWSEPPEEHYTTVVSAVIDLQSQSMDISDGPPCTNPYQTVALEKW